MRIRKPCVTALALVAALAVVAPAAAKHASKAKTRVVHPGQSIQAAIDKSKPGDTVLVKRGTYAENLQISTDRIKLKGQHAKLTLPSAPHDSKCNGLDSPGSIVGVCVIGDVTVPQNGPPTVTRQVVGVQVSGFTIRDFSGEGVFILGAKRTVVAHTTMRANGGYGVFSNTSSGTRYLHDVAADNKAPGFYVGDSPKANATVAHNVSRGNEGEGLLLRDATGGKVYANKFVGNCAGVAVLADAPGPAGNWNIHNNVVSANNLACPGDPGEGEPPVSGVGIGLVGAHDTKVVSNRVTKNKNLHESFASGGIVVLKGSGGTAPVNDLVKTNTATDNTPFDLDWDGSGTVTFKSNTCGTSSPSGLCS